MYEKCYSVCDNAKIYIGQMQPAFLISEGYYPHSWMVVVFLDGITLKCISLFILSKYMRVSKTTPQMLHTIKFFLVASFDD